LGAPVKEQEQGSLATNEFLWVRTGEHFSNKIKYGF